jgi:hypothetical protein
VNYLNSILRKYHINPAEEHSTKEVPSTPQKYLGKKKKKKERNEERGKKRSN